MTERRGFTLVELLVVISILALLISLLLPSLARSRNQAKSVVCLTHLRQLAHGWHLYADENEDTCLPGRYAKLSGGTTNPANWYEIGNGLKYRPRWIATMGAYVGMYAFGRPRTDFDRQDYDSNVYRCPSAAERVDERNHAYGYNHQFLGNARKTNNKYHNYPVNRSRIRNFSGTVLGADCMGTAAGFSQLEKTDYENDGTLMSGLGNHGWALDPPRLTATSDRGTGDEGSTRTAPDPRHLNKTNVIYCDGHGETASIESLGYRIVEGGAFADADQTDAMPDNSLFSGTGRDDDPPDLPR